MDPEQYVHTTRRDAIAALKRVGAPHDPRFDLKATVEGYGEIERLYGFLGNVVDLEGMVEEPMLVRRLMPLLKDLDNEKLYETVRSGRMDFTPVNKRVVRRIAEDLLEAGVHLPWTWRPMNFDFAARANDAHRKSPLPFIVFYSQQTNFSPGGVAKTSRVFSLPIEGLAQGTWAEPINNEILDPDVGLFIEANCRV